MFLQQGLMGVPSPDSVAYHAGKCLKTLDPATTALLAGRYCMYSPASFVAAKVAIASRRQLEPVDFVFAILTATGSLSFTLRVTASHCIQLVSSAVGQHRLEAADWLVSMCVLLC